MNAAVLKLLCEPFYKPHVVIMYEDLHQGVKPCFYNILKQQPKVELRKVRI